MKYDFKIFNLEFYFDIAGYTWDSLVQSPFSKTKHEIIPKIDPEDSLQGQIANLCTILGSFWEK